MPDYCRNRLKVTGRMKDLRSFRRQAIGPGRYLSFDKFIPMPDVFRHDEPTDKATEEQLELERLLLHGAENWHEWCCQNWGTKWDACSLDREKSSSMLVYDFDTAWTPPLPVVEVMAEQYPGLNFELQYYSDDIQVFGTLVFEEGDEVCHDTQTPNELVDEMDAVWAELEDDDDSEDE